MKFAFYTSEKGTRPIKTLEYLLETRSPLLKDIAFVFNDNLPHPAMREVCEKTGTLLREKDLSSVDKKERGLYVSGTLLDIMEETGADYLFIFTKRLLKGELLNRFQWKIINFHPSLLPSFKGFNAIDQAIEANAFILGNTAHFIDHGADTGPIIMQSVFPRTLYKDYDDVLDQQIPMIVQIMQWLKEERLSVKDGEVKVQNAIYQGSDFIPALEIKQ